MSYIAVEWCRPFKISGWPKAVLFCLADHHNENTGRCDPSLLTIAREMGCSEQTARRSLRWLADHGYIVLQPRIGLPSLIALRLEQVYACQDGTPYYVVPLPPRHEPLPNEQGTPATQTLTPATVVPKPLEPSMKPLEPKTPLPPMEDSDVQANGHEGTAMGLGSHQASDADRAVGGQFDLAGDGPDRCACSDAKDAWNATAERCGWPRVQRFTPPRAKATEARLKEFGGLPGWSEMLGKLEASPFFREKWQPTFDWILKPANFAKVVEGNYDRRGPPNRDAEIEAALARSRT